MSFGTSLQLILHNAAFNVWSFKTIKITVWDGFKKFFLSHNQSYFLMAVQTFYIKPNNYLTYHIIQKLEQSLEI